MRPLILITNDDGILSPGLRAAIEAVTDLGDILVAAPSVQQTAMGHSLPKTADLGIIELCHIPIAGASVKGFGIHASPAYVVSHAILELSDRKPALCLSGINYGENLGLSIFPSGTVAAALEAAWHGIPSLAVSLEAPRDMHYASEYGNLDWGPSQHFARLFARKVLSDGLSRDISLLNINIPSCATIDTTIRFTRQSLQRYYVFERPAPRDFMEAFSLRVNIDVNRALLEPDSDIHAVIIDRAVSVTPLTSDLTATFDVGDLK